MKVDDEMGVKHAILRRKRVVSVVRDDSSTSKSSSGWTYRCGKVGPYSTLNETLR